MTATDVRTAERDRQAGRAGERERERDENGGAGKWITRAALVRNESKDAAVRQNKATTLLTTERKSQATRISKQRTRCSETRERERERESLLLIFLEQIFLSVTKDQQTLSTHLMSHIHCERFTSFQYNSVVFFWFSSQAE